VPDVVVVILALVLLAMAGGALVLLRMPPTKLAGTVDGVDSVEVRLAGGRVEIGEYDRHDARVELTFRRRPGQTAPTVTRVGRVLRVEGRSSEALARLRLPRRTGVRAEIRRGEITLWGSEGDLSLVTETGPIAGRELAGGRVSARTRDGDVTLHFSGAPAGVTAVSERGAVTLVLPDDRYDLDVETADPAAASVGMPSAPGAERRVRARSVSGRVQVKAASPLGPVRI